MTSNDHELDDPSLDTMIESIARDRAPDGFAARVSAAIDAQGTTPIARGRLVFAMAAAAAAIVVLAGAVWMTSRHATPPAATVAHTAPRATPGVSPTPTAAASSEPQEQPAPGAMPPRGAHALKHQPSPPHDHDRALQALDAVPAVLQPDIAPRSLDTSSIDIDRMNAITPLTVQGGRDASGRGDF